MIEVRVPDDLFVRYGVSGGKEMIAMWAHQEGIAVDFKDSMTMTTPPFQAMVMDFIVHALFQNEKDAVLFKLRWC